ncbi:peptide/nickel transport system substrate-binding protein/oligopeptide transport system substrate-binding protein [Antricoccus suffuscus]|uniref:Peptide/nickel transport system substrate-binding protein/oligopeptide transport system substrate-binding protein n=1 Tax=Antricoccus suffuscus TaxID=1629062 RepID=A0A2T1A1V8_9ACTN|nr:peptide/nickel transport system substrate-binding protein/oligopeptide transport system substrate-binding protein [Antricoccus suffuscus]
MFKFNSRAVRLLGVTAASLLLTTGCFSGSSGDKNDVKVNQQKDAGPPQNGGVLRIATPADPPSLDPIKDPSYQTMYAIGYSYSKLIDYKIGKDVPFGTDELEGDLAEKWEMSDDGLTWTFHLRKGVKWQNVAPVSGREFTSKDVACTIAAIKERGHQKGDVSAVTSVDTPDDYTVVFNLDKPYPDMAYKLAGNNLWMLPCEGTSGQFNLQEQAIGTGPFILTEWAKDKSRTYVKNPDYYVKNKPYLDGVEYINIPDTAASVAALRTGKIDVVGTVTDMDTVNAVLKTNPDTYVTKELYSPAMFYMNMAEEPFQNLKVRQAISMAIDREGMMNTVRPGGALTGPVSSYAVGALSPEEVKKLQPYDVEAAKKLLTEAGYPDGFETTMMVTTGYGEVVVNEAQWVQEDLAKIGIKANIDVQDYGTYIGKSWPTKNYKSGQGLQTPWLTADDFLISMYYSKGTRNWYNINDPKLDEMILDQRSIMDPDKRNTELQDIQKYIIKNVMNPVMLYNYNALTLYGGYIHDIYPQPEYGYRHVMNMWMDETSPTRK